MPAYLNAISGAVPRHAYPQQRILEVMREWHGADRRAGRLLGGIYRASEIDCRHSVIDDFQPGASGGFFYDPDTGEFLSPTTGERNELYKREATPLAAQAARRVLDDARAAAAGITHLITVSCTGFFAPGPDIELIHELGLNPGVERYHIGFMGCYAAIPALRLARSLVEARPESRVLIVSVELCTLHLQAQHDPDSLVAASVFSDGAAAALVTGRREGPRSYRLDRFATALVPGASREMAWTIGDSGFLMTLSSKIPAVIEEHLEGAVGQLLEGEDPGGFSAWAVHPGGRAILDSVEKSLPLPAGGLAASRDVLRQFGNMSSATVLFVLERILRTRDYPPGPVGMLAFGPGLTVEGAVLSLEE